MNVQIFGNSAHDLGRRVYGDPYMTASTGRLQDQVTAPPPRGPAGECLRLTLRGFSPQELTARAEEACNCHFGECEWKMDKAEFVPCVGSLGGRVRLYEGRFVASS